MYMYIYIYIYIYIYKYIYIYVTNGVDDEYKFYYGLTESSFKARFRSHTKPFKGCVCYIFASLFFM